MKLNITWINVALVALGLAALALTAVPALAGQQTLLIAAGSALLGLAVPFPGTAPLLVSRDDAPPKP